MSVAGKDNQRGDAFFAQLKQVDQLSFGANQAIRFYIGCQHAARQIKYHHQRIFTFVNRL